MAIKRPGRFWDTGGAAIDQIAQEIRKEEIACNFKWVPGYLHAPRDLSGGGDEPLLQREAAFARRLGIDAEFLDAVPVFERPGVKFPHQAIFHPRKYLAGLVQKIPDHGSHVFEAADVKRIDENPLTVAANERTIRCHDVVIATHAPSMGATGLLGAAVLQSKLALYSTYVIGARVPGGKLPEACFWDTSEPYHYLRVNRRHGHDQAIFGGGDHKTGQEPDTAGVYQKLEKRFLGLVPDAQVEHRWSGQ